MTDPPASGSAAARVVEGVRTYRVGGVEVRALDGVTIDFARGQFTSVVGPSGSGKTTLLHCLAGLDCLTSGEVYLGDVELGALTRTKRAQVRRRNVGIVFQGFNLHPGLDVEHNIALPSVVAGRKPNRDWLEGIVTRLRLGDLLDRRPAELSGGEQQRAAAARALAGQPQLLLADEPTGNLDMSTGRELLDTLRVANQELGQTVILVTHDLAAACIADRVVVFGDGRVLDVVDAPTIERLTGRVRASTN